MTELMKQYEGERVERDVIKYFEDMSPKQQVVKAFYVQCLFQEFKKLEAINKWLEAQLTWKPVSEKPKKAGVYFVEARPYAGCDSTIITTAYFDGESFLWHAVVRWLPVPPALEGEVK